MAEEKVEEGREERNEKEANNRLMQPRHGALNVCNLVQRAWKERRPGGCAAAAAIVIVVGGGGGNAIAAAAAAAGSGRGSGGSLRL